jgi:FkbM family methyltransferase
MNFLSASLNTVKHFRKFGMAGVTVSRKSLAKDNSEFSISIPQAQHKIYLRGGTSDIGIFDEVFFLEGYKYDYKNPGIIFDCGANVGLTSVYYKNCFPQARIIAIEPDPANFTLLKKNTAPYQDIECLQMGLWHKEALLEIHNRHFNNNSGFAVEEVAKKGPETIEAITIPAIMQRYGISEIDVLKMDIEGAEKELFSYGADQWLPHVKTLVIETHDFMKSGTAKSVFSALQPYDYNVHIQGSNFFITLNR